MLTQGLSPSAGLGLMFTAGFVSLWWFGVYVNSMVCLSDGLGLMLTARFFSLCWFVVDVNNGVWLIVDVNSGVCLSLLVGCWRVSWGSRAAGIRLWWWPNSGEQTSCSHKWSLTEAGRNQRCVSFAHSYNDATCGRQTSAACCCFPTQRFEKCKLNLKSEWIKRCQITSQFGGLLVSYFHSLISWGCVYKPNLRKFSANTELERHHDIIEYIAKTQQNTPTECTHTRLHDEVWLD